MNSKYKKTVAVIFGGRSAEHDVSIITAHIPIIKALEVTKKYNVIPIYISKGGNWYSEKAMNDLEYFKDPSYQNKLIKTKSLQISFDDGLTIYKPGLKVKKIKIDIVFPAMHGTYGEDGSLTGLLRMANVPFVGCDIFASAVAMDKVLTKQVISAEGAPVVPYVWFTQDDWTTNKKELTNSINKLKWPVYVKPVHLGSSIGITKVKDKMDLENAIEVALHYDNKVVIEESIEDLIEVTLPMLGNESPHLAMIERPLNNTEFFDFNDKYLSGGKKGGDTSSVYSELPAEIGTELTKKVQELSKLVYKTIGCEGIARIDFLIDIKNNKVYVNEVNTLPGSLYHHNWKKSGVSNVDLVMKLIDLAEDRFNKSSTLSVTFKSNILSKVGGGKI